MPLPLGYIEECRSSAPLQEFSSWAHAVCGGVCLVLLQLTHHLRLLACQWEDFKVTSACDPVASLGWAQPCNGIASYDISWGDSGIRCLLVTSFWSFSGASRPPETQFTCCLIDSTLDLNLKFTSDTYFTKIEALYELCPEEASTSPDHHTVEICTDFKKRKTHTVIISKPL